MQREREVLVPLASKGERLWVERMSVFTRFFGLLTLCGGLLLADLGIAYIVGYEKDDPDGWMFLPMGALAAAFALSVSLRPKVEAWTRGVLVLNSFVEYWVPWSQIASIKADMRVEIHTATGEVVSTWAIQKTNIAAALELRSRTDRVASRLIAAHESCLQSSESPSGDHVRRRLASSHLKWTCTLALAAALAVPFWEGIWS